MGGIGSSEGETARALRQDLARHLRQGRGGFPRPLIIGIDPPEMAEKMAKEWGVDGVVWLPPIDPIDKPDDGAIRTTPEKRGEDCGAGG